MRIGVKFFDTFLEEVGEEMVIIDADTVAEVLNNVSEMLYREEPITLEDVCIFKNGINVELLGGEEAFVAAEDWLAFFPRMKRPE